MVECGCYAYQYARSSLLHSKSELLKEFFEEAKTIALKKISHLVFLEGFIRFVCDGSESLGGLKPVERTKI